MEDNES